MKLTAESTILSEASISQKFAELMVDADGIRTEVSKKVGNDEVISKINQSAESVQIQADKVVIEANNYVTAYGDNGVQIHPKNNTNDSIVLTPNGMSVYKGGTTSAYEIAYYGDAARIGKSSGVHLAASAAGLRFAGSNGRTVFDVHLNGTTTNRGITERFNSSQATLAGTPVSGTKMWVRCKDSTSGGETIFEFTAGTSASKTYDKGSSNYTARYSNGNNAIIMSGSNSPKVVWVSYTTAIPDTYTTLGIRAYADTYESASVLDSTPGLFSLAQGLQCRASGVASVALNFGTAADGDYQTVVGQYNVADTTSPFIVGKGTAQNSRANALKVDSNGNLRIRGNLYTNCNADSSGGSVIKSWEAVTLTALGKYWYFYKMGRLIVVSAYGDMYSASSGSNTVGTLPSDYRPVQATYLGVQNDTVNRFLIIGTDGQVSFYTPSAVTSATNCGIGGAYVTN